ncbi:RluA family pseudouridine synthase [Rhodoplanes serenus]|uniref:Pseudouridine synthase n=2 Tax=Rhodoplanes serenus TaxID=200615 RepID=A0A9X5AV00_9BRAD|nr:RluA family pseudouridine synthase [Rhodoplanes serenus]
MKRACSGSSGVSAAVGVSGDCDGAMMGEDRRIETVVIAAPEAGDRLDRVLAARLTDFSRSRLKTLIIGGHVAIGDRTIRDPGQRVNANDRVHVTVPPPEPPEPQPEPIALSVVHEDDDLLVIDKPAGLVVHPAAGHWSGTLVNALVAHCGDSLSGIGGVRRPGIVHRLDKDTTGLMVVAKSDRAHRSLARQFADHGRRGPLERGYLAFVWGGPDRPRGVIDKPIGRHPQARDKMSIQATGREAVTHWETVQTYRGKAGEPVAALLACRLETGRTHQIRVHLASIGHPLIGDPVYGPGFRTKAALLPAEAQSALAALGRQALHAYLLGIQHPSSRKALVFRSDLPADLARLHKALGGGTIDLARR